MPNHAYASIWCRDFSEEVMLERLGRFLSTVPFSAGRQGFTDFAIRAIGPAETPLLEPDFRSSPAAAAVLVELARDHLHPDSAYEARAFWDLWVPSVPAGAAAPRWLSQPEPLEVFCYGEQYDDGDWKENGHFEVDAGLEHLFTGHARLLGFGSEPLDGPQNPEEERFVEMMTQAAAI